MKKKINPKKGSSPTTRNVSNRKKKLASKRKLSKTRPTIESIAKGRSKKIGKRSTKKITAKGARKKAGSKTKSRVVSKTSTRPQVRNRIVRIMGQGQFTVDSKTMKRLNSIDDSIVKLVSTESSDDTEFANRLTELTKIVQAKGKPLDPKKIVESDIILPSSDLSRDEAVDLFKGEGVIPDTEL